MIKVSAVLFSLFFAAPSIANTTTEVICSYAPSQSAVVNRISSLAGGTSLGAEITMFANGLSVLPHSSGGVIMAGSGGYIAGTMTGSVITTTIVTAGVVVAGTALTVELACVPKNHPKLIAKLKKDSSEYSNSANELLKNASVKTKYVTKSTLDELSDKLKRYKTLTKDKFYELLGETWYQKTVRKTKEAFTD